MYQENSSKKYACIFQAYKEYMKSKIRTTANSKMDHAEAELPHQAEYDMGQDYLMD
jgi:hypothetical protein